MASRRWLRGQSDVTVSLSAPRLLTTLGASRSTGPFDEVRRVYGDFATALGVAGGGGARVLGGGGPGPGFVVGREAGELGCSESGRTVMPSCGCSRVAARRCGASRRPPRARSEQRGRRWL